MDEFVYALKEIDELDKIEEFVEEYILGEDKQKRILENKEIKNIEEEKMEIIPINLSNLKFYLYPLKKQNQKNKSIILKSKRNFKMGEKTKFNNIGCEDEIKVKNDIESKLCFVLFYEKKEKFNFLFEELIEKIIKKIEKYETLMT